ncbi:RNA-binding protein [Rhodanobacter thiooxydans]|uniref:Heat shock protein 15 n=1 Tax=Rhodanobacter thiooxydans TaxID=416169 RepID=A0A154QF53_9GAMM|nr:RNA-binding S4 domain-containing protein [Rhodanobacter thiooxydans]KZC22865.1 RNA-binding protein [Rhodanobacter thiooxydans]MCW0200706.1 RNA-binding S4 domain-containing protein [Rhodanobacter thiooxydans]
MSKPPDPPMTDLRADVWLWAARFFKTRSLAKQAIDGGRIDVNGAGCKPAKSLRAGDRLKIGRGEERLEVEVVALSDRRAPAAVAQALYVETAASRAARELAREQQRLVGPSGPPKRPDKQARRELRRLRDTR